MKIYSRLLKKIILQNHLKTEANKSAAPNAAASCTAAGIITVHPPLVCRAVPVQPVGADGLLW